MFITFEGIEGSGKSTQIRHLEKHLRELGRVCLTTKEPGGTDIGRQLRSVLLDPENSDIHPVTELLLYAADRNQHIQQVIKPALEAGKTVICDRFHDSTVVYQGFCRGLDCGLVSEINRLVLSDFRPDITFVLDLEPGLGLERAWHEVDSGGRSSSETRFENETLAFHARVRQGYLELAEKEPERFIVVDAGRDEQTVRSDIISAFSEKCRGFF